MLKQKDISTAFNFSNQANYSNDSYAELYQCNIAVIFGEEYLNSNDAANTKIPLSIRVSKSRELEISSIDGEIISNENNITMYSDVKVSKSED